MNYLLNLSCDKSILGNNALFFTLIISAFLNPISSFIADKFGRKSMFILSTFTNFVGVILSLLSLSYLYIVIGVSIQLGSKIIF